MFPLLPTLFDFVGKQWSAFLGSQKAQQKGLCRRCEAAGCVVSDFVAKSGAQSQRPPPCCSRTSQRRSAAMCGTLSLRYLQLSRTHSFPFLVVVSPPLCLVVRPHLCCVLGASRPSTHQRYRSPMRSTRHEQLRKFFVVFPQQIYSLLAAAVSLRNGDVECGCAHLRKPDPCQVNYFGKPLPSIADASSAVVALIGRPRPCCRSARPHHCGHS